MRRRIGEVVFVDGSNKTFLRDRIGEERLNGVALMYIHKDIRGDVRNVRTMPKREIDLKSLGFHFHFLTLIRRMFILLITAKIKDLKLERVFKKNLSSCVVTLPLPRTSDLSDVNIQ